MKIKIMGVPIKIQQIPRKKIERDECGHYVPEHKVINIADDMGWEYRSRTVVHEITHAILDIGGVGPTLDDKVEEGICFAMENLAPLILDGSLLLAMSGVEKDPRRKR